MSDVTRMEEFLNLSDKLYREMSSSKEKSREELYINLTEMGRILVDADRASFWKWDKRRHQLWTKSAVGVESIVIPDNTGLVGKALKEGRVVITNDPYNDPDFNSNVDKQTGYVTKSILVMPVANIYGEYIGAFQIINKNDDKQFSETDDVRRLSNAALILALALESETFLEESHHDKLTKLKNRMGFYHDFSKRYASVLKEGRPLSMFISDIDKFKRVNDTYGHNAGDDVLVHVAALIESFAPENGGVYRWGGEEFIMMLPDATVEDAAKLAEEVRVKLQGTPCKTHEVIIDLTMSFGCNQFDSASSIEDNISVADGRLYTAKETGRNQVIWKD